MIKIAVQPAASGLPGNVDVTFEVDITNDGNTRLDNITLSENIAAQFGPAFVGVIPGSGSITACWH